jgi:Predicted Rossmann fold nucleotide-binding protein involved in DNA uptake
MTGMVSNQIMLKIIKLSINSANLESETFNLLKKELDNLQFEKFLLLFSKNLQTKYQAINYLDEAYPQMLRTIYNPPALLFFREILLYLKLIASQSLAHVMRQITVLVALLVLFPDW